ncbi:MAG: hypothetical protein P8L36_03830 [SAR324 cluster bacterium]|nr:hypothetical protein [SAR324 cluster bacterium]
MKNGPAFLLGELIKSSTGQSLSGLPFFKDLPLLGPPYSGQVLQITASIT